MKFLFQADSWYKKMSDEGIEDEGLIYPCSKCDVIYRSASHLRKHTYNVHHDRELVCEICDVKGHKEEV